MAEQLALNPPSVMAFVFDGKTEGVAHLRQSAEIVEIEGFLMELRPNVID